MRILVACEFSGTVREAFAARGHDAWSCDLLPTERPGNHIVGDALSVIADGWDLMVAHPPCTHLAVSGSRWFAAKRAKAIGDGERDPQVVAVEFAAALLNAPIPRICVENPVSVLSSRLREPDQIIQPWMFGHGEVKATCLWLKGLPALRASNVVEGREARIHNMGPSPNRWRERSRTFAGIAEAMAEQWGSPTALTDGLPLFAKSKEAM